MDAEGEGHEPRTRRLDGARALVTGGSRGLGRAIAVALGRAGARVALTWTRDEAAARTALEAVRAAQGWNAAGAKGNADANASGIATTDDRARAYRVSVTDLAATQVMVKELERDWGGLTALVNNAAISQTLPLALLEPQDWDRMMEVNVKGAFFTSKAVLQGMIRRRAGVIVNIGSIAGVRMIEAPIHYVTSKAAIKGMTEALAKEVVRYGVRVNAVAPGLLEGGIGAQLPEHRRRDYIDNAALRRAGRFDEIAEMVAFLLSDEASYMTGETIVMDGGL